MKKYTIIGVVILIALIVVGLFYFKKGDNSQLTTQTVAQLFSKKYNQPADTYMIQILNNTGDFAKGSVNIKNGGGGLWFAAKTSKGWELAIDGNGIPSCSAVNKYNIPKDMITACLDDKNELIQR